MNRLAWALLLVACGAFAQEFPSKPVRIVSPYPAGLTPDVAARALADRLSRTWNQPVIIEARPGANGFLAMSQAKKAAPDGYELAVAGQAHLAINPRLFKSVPYDPEKDFAPVSTIYRTVFVIFVSTAGPYGSVRDLIAAAKSSQRKLSYSSPYIGSPPHLGAARLAYLAGAEMVHVPFKETAQIFTAVANGDVDFALSAAGAAQGLVKAGKLKIIAVTARTRDPDRPDIPTVEQAGGPAGCEADTWVSLVAPHGTPEGLALRVSRDIAAALADPDVRERFKGAGVDPMPSTPAELSGLVKRDLAAYGDIIQRTGVTAE